MLAAPLTVAVVLAGCGGDDAKGAGKCTANLGAGLTPDVALAAAAKTPDSPVQVRAGSPLTGAGIHFDAGCGQADQAGKPLQGIRILVVQGAQRISVAEVNAATDQSFTVTFGVPPRLTPGPAQVVAQLSLDANATVLASAPFLVAA